MLLEHNPQMQSYRSQLSFVTIRWSIHNSPLLYSPAVDPISPPSKVQGPESLHRRVLPTLVGCNVTLTPSLPIFIFTFTTSLSRMRGNLRQRHFPDSCTCGGGGGYRTLVLHDFQSASTNCNYIYTTLNTFCQDLFSSFITFLHETN